MTQHRKKQIYLSIAVILVGGTIVSSYSTGNELLHAVRAHAYVYGYTIPKNLKVDDTSKLPPAEAVPILMYHGVINSGPIGPNTSRRNFIAQMEMLKREGYQTISVHEYDLFREGKFTLPPKPVIITFDDGRKDSFYPTDDILKGLGFKATLFVATTKANEREPFYLSWDELRKVKDTGRWEIEAHGRLSHEEIILDDKGNTGSYLIARAYLPGGILESIEEYKTRVERDYVEGIADLKKNLGINARYYAVPLNHYGVYEDSNYEGSHDYNVELTKRFFRLAFVQAAGDDNSAFESFYNYKDSRPMYEIKRLDVKNMSAENLLRTLEHFAPRKPALSVSESGDYTIASQNVRLLYGKLKSGNSVTLSGDAAGHSGRILLGDSGWKNYAIETTISREKGRSVSVIIYYADEENYISLNWSGQFLELIEYRDNKERVLASAYAGNARNTISVTLSIHNGIVTAFFDSGIITNGVPTLLPRGAAGFGVWDPSEIAQGTLKKFELKSIDAPVRKTFPSVPVTSSVPVETQTGAVVEAVPIVIKKTLPFYTNRFNETDWKDNWGVHTVIDGALRIGSLASSTGSNISLSGSTSWTNYVVKTKVDWLKNDTFSLLVRMQDPNNYIACSYTNYGASASLVEVVNGRSSTIIETYSLSTPFYTPWLDVNLGASVRGNHVECLINDQWVLKYDFDNLSSVGGIGFETWDPMDAREDQMLIKEISVSVL